MKKFIALLLSVAMFLSLVACGNDTATDAQKNEDAEEAEEEEEESITIEKDGVVYIRQSKFGELLERVELTTENWKDYIKVYSGVEETIHKDAFGEVVSTESTTFYYIGADNERYHQFQDAVIELKNKETGELTVYDLAGNGSMLSQSCYVTEDFNLDDYECTRIKGRLYFVDLPEEAILSPVPNWDYDCGFILYSESSQTPYSINMATKKIALNSAISWDECLS